MFDKLYIDGDWLIYLIAATCEDSYIEVNDVRNDEEFIEWKNITTFKKHLKDNNDLFISDNYSIEFKKRLKRPDVKTTGIYSLKSKIRKIQQDCNAKEVIIALAGESNFRDRLALPVKYKGNRDNLQKPLLLKYIRSWVEENYTCEIAIDQEADDIISINQYLGSKDAKTVVCTLDKDSRSIPGYLYNPNTCEIIHIEGYGNHSLKTNKSKKSLYGEGRAWEYIQWIHGDQVDNYHPQDLMSKKMVEDKRSSIIQYQNKKSPAKIWEETKKFKTDIEWLTYAHDLFYEWYNDLEWYLTWDDKKIINPSYLDIFQIYVDVVHMRRWDGDTVDIKKVLKQFKIV